MRCTYVFLNYMRKKEEDRRSTYPFLPTVPSRSFMSACTYVYTRGGGVLLATIQRGRTEGGGGCVFAFTLFLLLLLCPPRCTHERTLHPPSFLSANIEGRVMDLRRRRRRLHVRTYEQTTWTPTAIIIRGRWSFAGRTGRTYSSSPLPMCTRGTNTQTGNNNIDYDRPQRRRRREKCQEQ